MLPIPDFERFYGTIEALTSDMKVHAEAVAEADERSRKAQLTAKLGIVVGGLGVLAAVIGLTAGLMAKTTADDIESSRRESRVTSCVQQNVTTEATREAFVTGLLALTGGGNGDLTPEQQVRLDRYKAHVAESLPYRDCSDEGIKSYFAGPPGDPAREG